MSVSDTIQVPIKRVTADPFAGSIAAVIVSYNPDKDFGKRLSVIKPQVDHIIIVDNGSNTSIYETLNDFISGDNDIIENKLNMGIAVALNQGVKKAMQLGFSWVLTLDQDTEIDPNMVSHLVSILSNYPDKGALGIIGSNARSKHSGHLFMDCGKQSSEFMDAKTVITSGSLMSLSAYEITGSFREDFFIEGVDLEYCLRLRRNGFKVLMSCKPLMTHAAGKMEEHRFLGRVVLVANHEPWRYYCMLRNLAQISRVYVRQEPRWVLDLCFNIVKMIIKIAFFEENRFIKVKYIFVGIIDGLSKMMRCNRRVTNLPTVASR